MNAQHSMFSFSIISLMFTYAVICQNVNILDEQYTITKQKKSIESANENKLKSEKIKIKIEKIFFLNEIPGYAEGDQISLVKLKNDEGSFFAKLADDLDNIWNSYKIGFAIGFNHPYDYNHAGCPRVGYSDSEREGLAFSFTGENNIKTEILLRNDFQYSSEIIRKVSTDESFTLNLYVFKFKQGNILVGDGSLPRQLIKWEKLTSIDLPINNQSTFSLIIHFDGKNWSLSYE